MHPAIAVVRPLVMAGHWFCKHNVHLAIAVVRRLVMASHSIHMQLLNVHPAIAVVRPLVRAGHWIRKPTDASCNLCGPATGYGSPLDSQA